MLVVQVGSVDDCPPNWSIIQGLQEPEVAELDTEKRRCSAEIAVPESQPYEPGVLPPPMKPDGPGGIQQPCTERAATHFSTETLKSRRHAQVAPEEADPSSIDASRALATAGSNAGQDSLTWRQPASWTAARSARQAHQQVCYASSGLDFGAVFLVVTVSLAEQLWVVFPY